MGRRRARGVCGDARRRALPPRARCGTPPFFPPVIFENPRPATLAAATPTAKSLNPTAKSLPLPKSLTSTVKPPTSSLSVPPPPPPPFVLIGHAASFTPY